MKKALCLASVASNLYNFNRDNVDILLSLGYDVTIASNFDTEEDVIPCEKVDTFKKEMISKGIHIEQIDFTRSLINIRQQIKSIKQIQALLKNKYNLIHCHSPICSAITRFSARKWRKKYGTRVIYTAHGFHFYNGAPAKNWAFYYPIEKIMSRYTDTLVTINTEDYNRAKEHLHAKKTEYIHGIGIDTNKFSPSSSNLFEKRNELGLSDDEIMILSVGEINKNKNQEIVIRSLAEIKNKKLHYFIAGLGQMQPALAKLSKELNVESNIHFLGYRSDVPDLCHCADLFIFPSHREGLPVALMEAIACKVPVICSNIRGNTDLISDNSNLFDPNKVSSLSLCIRDKLGSMNRNEIKYAFEKAVNDNYKLLLEYSIEHVHSEMLTIYRQNDL